MQANAAPHQSPEDPRAGRIINIGSVLGLFAMPYGALYAATKHAIEGYSEEVCARADDFRIGAFAEFVGVALRKRYAAREWPSS